MFTHVITQVSSRNLLQVLKFPAELCRAEAKRNKVRWKSSSKS